MANIDAKQLVVDELKSKIETASSAVLIDTRGLTVEQDTKLRRELREAGVLYKVYKNTIMRHAFKETAFAGLDEYLAGPNCLALSYEDPTAAARIINKNLKDMKIIKFNAGCIEGTVYNAEMILAVANIPPRDILLSRLFGSFKSPISKFARVIKAISDDKSENEQAV